MKRTALYITVLVGSALLIGGCGNEEKAALQEQNVMLNQRVSELEYQLSQSQTQAPAYANAQAAGPEVPTSVYLVVQGDTLWSIAKKQLGSGARYKEILALNPHIQPGKPLAIGTRLTLPSR